MSANLAFLIAFSLIFIGMLALMTLAVKCGLKWAKIADVSFPKAFGLYLLLILVSGVVRLCAMFVHSLAPDKINDLVMNCVECPIELIAPCLVVASIYKVRLLRAALGAIPFFVCGFAIIALMFVERAYIYEAYSIPTNGMAPTLLGEHLEAPCPRCGAPAYGSPIKDERRLPPDGWPMVCSKEMITVNIADPPKCRGSGDRILVCKLLKPKRWDLIAFRYPRDPAVMYAKRLVGLPGEKLEIREGAIWINGEKIGPPDAIRGIRYSPTVESYGRKISGPGSVPVQLGADEYFVLGDFVEQSSDSRFWEQGAPGHPPYAVPRSYVDGVVINIYWPPSRWTSFR